MIYKPYLNKYVYMVSASALALIVGVFGTQPLAAHAAEHGAKIHQKQTHIIKNKTKKSETESSENADEQAEAADLAQIEKDESKAPPFLLGQALVQAYTQNPAVQAARAQLRSVDETYAQAVSGFRPQVNGIASYMNTNDKGNLGHYRTDQKQLTLQVRQPVYSGGSTVAQMNSSENKIKAERASLQATEQDVLLQTVTAYMDVLRDREIMDLNRYNEKVLGDRLKEARERYKLGDITKTDVSQAESRLAAATAERVGAQGNYRVSRARFEKIVGLAPEGLRKPALVLSLPQDLDTAVAAAERDNPRMKSAVFMTSAAGADVRAAEGKLLPQVDMIATADKYYDPMYSANNQQSGTSFTLQATVPLYEGGGDYSRIRQAKQTRVQREMNVNDVRRTVRQAVVDAWEQLAAARAEKDARAAQVRAARIALKGVQVETDYGSRTTLDLLDAEREYRDAQVAYASAERDQIVASYGLLDSMGRLTVGDLHLQTAAYDPVKNFRNVSHKWIGTGIHGD